MSKKMRSLDYNKLGELEDLSVDEEDFVSKLISKFLSLLPERMEKLRLAVESRLPDQIRREVHIFNTSCQILGAVALSKYLEQLAATAQDQDFSHLQDIYSKVTVASQEVEQELRVVLAGRSGGSKANKKI